MTDYTPQEQALLDDAADLDIFTFIGVEWIETTDHGFWQRFRIADNFSLPDADGNAGQFIIKMAGTRYLLAGCVKGDIAVVDEESDGDEPTELQARQCCDQYGYETDPKAMDHKTMKPYTVFGVWDTGRGFQQWYDHVPAANPLHAQSLVRLRTKEGIFRFGGVLDGFIRKSELPELSDFFAWEGVMYALPTTEVERLKAEQAKADAPKHHFWSRD